MNGNFKLIVTNVDVSRMGEQRALFTAALSIDLNSYICMQINIITYSISQFQIFWD